MTPSRILTLTAAACLLAVAAVPAGAGIVINEIDYDQPGTDTAEWVELFNPDSTPQSLDGFDMVFVNASTCLSYRTDALDGFTIPAGGYIVFGYEACAASALGFPASNAIQNGSPDDIFIVDRGTGSVVDGVEYEQPGASDCGGTPTNATDSGTVDGSIQLCSDGWAFFETATPCEPNNCPVPAQSATWGILKSLYR